MQEKEESMRKMIIIILVLMAFGICRGGDAKKEYISIEEESKMKEYNPNAVWRVVPCSKCGGAGHQAVYKYDTKANRTIKYLVPCQYCKGSGTVGMSKM